MVGNKRATDEEKKARPVAEKLRQVQREDVATDDGQHIILLSNDNNKVFRMRNDGISSLKPSKATMVPANEKKLDLKKKMIVDALAEANIPAYQEVWLQEVNKDRMIVLFYKDQDGLFVVDPGHPNRAPTVNEIPKHTNFFVVRKNSLLMFTTGLTKKNRRMTSSYVAIVGVMCLEEPEIIKTTGVERPLTPAILSESTPLTMLLEKYMEEENNDVNKALARLNNQLDDASVHYNGALHVKSRNYYLICAGEAGAFRRKDAPHLEVCAIIPIPPQFKEIVRRWKSDFTKEKPKYMNIPKNKDTNWKDAVFLPIGKMRLLGLNKPLPMNGAFEHCKDPFKLLRKNQSFPIITDFRCVQGPGSVVIFNRVNAQEVADIFDHLAEAREALSAKKRKKDDDDDESDDEPSKKKQMYTSGSEEEESDF